MNVKFKEIKNFYFNYENESFAVADRNARNDPDEVHPNVSTGQIAQMNVKKC